MLPNLRPRGIGEILDAAVALYREKFAALVGVTALVVVPLHVVNALITLSTAPDSTTIGAGGLQPTYDASANVWTPLAGNLASTALSLLATALATAAVVRLVADTYLGSSSTRADSTHLARRRLGAVLGLAVLTRIIVIAGLFMCLVPGLYLLVAWIVAVPALLLEDKTVGEAMSRSFQLTKGRWWKCFGVYLVGTLLTEFVTLVLAALVAAGIHTWSHGVAALAIEQGVSGAIAASLATPFLAAATIVLYFDLRVRGEGFDVQMALHQLDRARPSAPVVPAG